MFARPALDSVMSWIMAFSGFFVTSIISGVTYSFGIIYVAILQEFPGKESQTAWIMSINWGVVMLSSRLTIYFCQRLTTRITCSIGLLLGGLAFYLASKAKSIGMLYLTFGVIHGLGTSLSYISVLYLIRCNFRKHLDLACGVALAGFAVGGVFFSFMLPKLIESYGWRQAIAICGYITMATTVFSGVFVESETHIKKAKKNNEKSVVLREERESPLEVLGLSSSSSSPWRNKAFVVLTMALVLGGFVNSVPYCHAVNFAIKQGLDKTKASRLSIFISVGSFIGRVGVGKISGMFGMTRLFIVQTVLLALAVTTTLATLATSTLTLLLYACVFGAMDGGFGVMLGVVVDDIFLDRRRALKALGYLFTVFALPYFLGSPFAGWVYHITQDYHTVYYVCGAIYFVASCLISVVRCLQPDIETSTTAQDKQVIAAEEYMVTKSDTTSKPVRNRLNQFKTYSILDLPLELYVRREACRYSDFDECLCSVRSTAPMNTFCQQNYVRLTQSKKTTSNATNQYTDITQQISGFQNITAKRGGCAVSPPEKCCKTTNDVILDDVISADELINDVTRNDATCGHIQKNDITKVADGDRRFKDSCVTTDTMNDISYVGSDNVTNVDVISVDVMEDVTSNDVTEDDVIIGDVIRSEKQESLNQLVLMDDILSDNGYATAPTSSHCEDSDNSCSSQTVSDSYYGSL